MQLHDANSNRIHEAEPKQKENRKQDDIFVIINRSVLPKNAQRLEVIIVICFNAF
jgi:hypothetical protein